MGRALKPADDLLRPAVDAAIKALGLTDTDAGAVHLARLYADTVDQADRAQWLAERALDGIPAGDVETRAWVQALAAKVELKETLDKLGPKLLAVLESLGATPAARSRLTRDTKPATGRHPTGLAQLRAARRA